MEQSSSKEENQRNRCSWIRRSCSTWKCRLRSLVIFGVFEHIVSNSNNGNPSRSLFSGTIYLYSSSYLVYGFPNPLHFNLLSSDLVFLLFFCLLSYLLQLFLMFQSLYFFCCRIFTFLDFIEENIELIRVPFNHLMVIY